MPDYKPCMAFKIVLVLYPEEPSSLWHKKQESKQSKMGPLIEKTEQNLGRIKRLDWWGRILETYAEKKLQISEHEAP